MGILGYLLVGLAVLLALLAYYLLVHQRCLSPFSVSSFTIEPASLVYITYRGDYYQLMPTVESAKKAIDRYFKEIGKEARCSDDLTGCGVYYDVPQSLVDPTQARACIGFLIRDEDKFDVPAFLRFCKQDSELSSLSFSQIKLGRMQAYGAEFPFMGTASLLSNVMRGYVGIREWAVKQSGQLLERTVCSLETYQWSQKSMGICFVYGKSAQALFGLSKYPQPAIKSNVPFKTVKKLQ